MKLVTINNVLYSGRRGGGVFRGIADDDKEYRFVGNSLVMPRPPIEGEVWLIEGNIRKHPEYGPQVEIDWAKLEKPSGRLIVHSISQSKLFQGIGIKRVERLWEKHGERIYSLLDAGDPTPFKDDIGPDLADVLIDGWKQMSAVSEVYKWLDENGIPVRLAFDLMSVYPQDLILQLEENPFKILAFTNWEKANVLARSLGFADDDDLRFFAAADAVNYQRAINDHTWTERTEFVRHLGKLLDCSEPTAFKAYDVALHKGAVQEIADGVQGRGPGSMEAFIASQVMDMIHGRYKTSQMTFRARRGDKFFSTFFKNYAQNHNLNLNQEQRDAVELSLTSPFGLITGGAGVGKTTVLHAVVEAAKLLNEELYMMAFTGRAARRMEETSGHPASTIHSFCNKVDDCQIHLEQGEPIIIIDEASMIDLPTMFRICLRMQPGCKLIMVGDPGQLPPIGFGIVFHAFCNDAKIPKVELTEIHRQAAETGIPQVANNIRLGILPDLPVYKGHGSGVSFLDCPFDNITGTVLDVVDALGGFDKAQILSPLKRGKSGTIAINQLAHEFEVAGASQYQGYALGEPVIWLNNDYELGLMNGSLGKVTAINSDKLNILWNPEGDIEIRDVGDLDYAYCITVHKSQGSEFPHVIVPVFDSRLLDRTLLYTAVTRAKQQVVLVGDRKAFEKAVMSPGNASRRETAMHVHLSLFNEKMIS